MGWVVEVDPEVSMSLQLRWWQEVIQTRHHAIWAGHVCYVRMHSGGCVLAELGGVAALPHEVSLNFSR